jgi:hypothetical protein
MPGTDCPSVGILQCNAISFKKTKRTNLGKKMANKNWKQ